MDTAPPDVIDRFTGPYAFLSNFDPTPVTIDTRTYPTREHAYQAAKTLDPTWVDKITDTPTPAAARALGRQAPLRHGWNTHRHHVMREVVPAAFTTTPMRDQLLSTGDALLIEGNYWHDQYHGDCRCTEHAPWPGRNELGRLLMQIRSGLRQDPPTRWTRVAVTGHRPHLMTPTQTRYATTELHRLAAKLHTDHHTTTAITGLAQGADTIWADAARDAGMHLWSYIPFPDQAATWDTHAQQRWVDLKATSTRTVTLGTSYDVRLLHARNDLMLRDTDALIAVTRPSRTTGGTASTIRKAHTLGLPIITVDLDNLRTTAHLP